MKRKLPIGTRTFREIHEEGNYASVFYSHFAAAGLDVVVEDRSGHPGWPEPPRDDGRA